MNEKIDATFNDSSTPLPRAFVWRRIHSLTGVWLVLYLILHLFTNSQAALIIPNPDSGFISAVNAIQELPFLRVIEILFLAIPFALHAYWGVIYILQAKYNSFSSDGSTPSLTEYPRNHAYTWQRITSWILLFLIAFHVIHMRFLEYPIHIDKDNHKFFLVRLNEDSGLKSLADRLDVSLHHNRETFQESFNQSASLDAFDQLPLKDNQVVAVTPSFGTAELLMVRDSFKSPAMIFLYTVLVLSACFHAFNGLWTAMITWGVTLSTRSQFNMYKFAVVLMFLVAFLGLSAIWGTYWISIRS